MIAFLFSLSLVLGSVAFSETLLDIHNTLQGMIHKDRESQKLARKVAELSNSIVETNTRLRALNALCLTSLASAPHTTQQIRSVARVLALGQDHMWTLAQSQARATALQLGALCKTASVFRAPPQTCGVPGVFEWSDPEILLLHASDAGIRVLQDRSRDVYWSFYNPEVRRKL